MSAGERPTLLVVEDLNVAFGRGADRRQVVHGVSFTLAAGRSLALVGESGSGKSVIARTLVGLTGAGSQIRAARLDFRGRPLDALREREWRRVRGRGIGFVLQDALASLDPLRRVGAEVGEPLRVHRTVPREQVRDRVVELLREVGVPDPELRARQYAHQLSGGLRQRALIASAIACGPPLLVADEPTTALDAAVQAQILELLAERRDGGTGLLIISHDLSVVSRLADHTAVLRAGHIVERGPTASVLGNPRHPYTRSLLDAVPVRERRGKRLSAGRYDGEIGETVVHPDTAADSRGRTRTLTVAGPPVQAPAPPHRPSDSPGPARAPLVEVEGVVREFPGPRGSVRRAVDGVDLTVAAGRTVGLVGESGSGKSTLARLVLGLDRPDAGSVRLAGEPWSVLDERDRRPHRRRIQAVFQDPGGSFDPRHSVRRILGDSLARRDVPRGARGAEAAALLGQVGLDGDTLDRNPRQLSGGQRQRVAIARALATRPELIVCDEPVSALDVSVQAQVLDLLADLQRDLGVAYLFISHDLAVVAHMSDEVLVMRDGRVVERGRVDDVFSRPRYSYTRSLLDAVPVL